MEARQSHAYLLAPPLQALEASLQERRGPGGSTAASVAYAKAKEIMMSLIKRLKRSLAGGGAQGPQQGQQQARGAWRVDGGGARPGLGPVLASLLMLSCVAVLSLHAATAAAQPAA